MEIPPTPQIPCPFRLPHSCSLLNAELGWEHGCPESVCRTCLSLTGPDSPEARDFRLATQKKWIRVVLDNLGSATEAHIKALVQRHLTPQELQDLLANPETAWALEKTKAWAEARPSWEMALSFGKALLSRGFTGTKVDLTIKGTRHMSCFGETLEGTKVQEPCPSLALSHDKVHHYCNACGCGDKGLTHLDPNPDGYSKLDYPHLECPRKRPGFSNSL